jgi:hypothetical protein
MWINPKTGKGWTDAEEATFAEIMRIGYLTRIKAIQLFRRCRSNEVKAIRMAAEYGAAPRASASVNAARTANLKRFKEGHFLGQNRSQASAGIS